MIVKNNRKSRVILAFCLISWGYNASSLAQQQTVILQPNEFENGRILEDAITGYTDWLKQRFSDENLPGAAMAIVSKDKVLDVQTWGVRSSQSADLVDEDSLFRIASVSKTFAGTVASLLVTLDQQSWDTPINQLLPSIQIGTKPSSNTMTLKNIVSHTTGLMPHAYSNMLDDGVAYEKIQKKFHEIPTVCAPGDCYGYQNVVFSLIADVVEASTLKSYEDYLSQEIFLPLGMSTASTGLEQFVTNTNATTPHRKVRGSWRVTTNNPAYYSVAPAAGINASILDMAIWARANLGAYPDVLSESFLQKKQKPLIETPRGNYLNRWPGLEHAYYALGWRVFDYRGMRIIHHGGGVRGFRSEVALIPEKNLGMVVLFNAETNVANDIVPTFLDILFN